MPLVMSQLGSKDRVTLLGRSPLTVRYNTGEPFQIDEATIIEPGARDCIMWSPQSIHCGYSPTGVLGFTISSPRNRAARVSGIFSTATADNVKTIAGITRLQSGQAIRVESLALGATLYVPANTRVEVINVQLSPVTIDPEAADAGITCNRA